MRKFIFTLNIALFVGLLFSSCSPKQYGSVVYNFCVENDFERSDIKKKFVKILKQNNLGYHQVTGVGLLFEGQLYIASYNDEGSVMSLRNFEDDLDKYYISITKAPDIIDVATRNKYMLSVEGEFSSYKNFAVSNEVNNSESFCK